MDKETIHLWGYMTVLGLALLLTVLEVQKLREDMHTLKNIRPAFVLRATPQPEESGEGSENAMG